MVSRTELEIVWDGPVKGLAEHRVSITKFGPSLALLMKAVRRIASQKLQDALEPTATGRLATSAKNLDIEIWALKKGSGGFSTLITFDVPNDSQSLLFNQLPELVGVELLEAIESEAKGTHRNTAVRNYLKSLPTELTKQEYHLHENGRPIRRVELCAISLPKLEEPLPAFLQVQGRITGVGFDPGRWEVKVKGEEGAQVVSTATEQQVGQALDMRAQEVFALTVSGAAGTRLLVLENEEMRNKRPTLSDLFDKWDEAFRALA